MDPGGNLLIVPDQMNFFARCTKSELCPPPASVILLEAPSSHGELSKELAPRIKEHYVTGKILKKWARDKIAGYLAQKLATTKVGKSGDLGEILATEYINSSNLPYEVPINRLIWKDSRDLPMRGEDVIGFVFDQETLRFLKGEAKSRKKLTKDAVIKARAALEKNSGLPLPFTLSFIVERLFESGQDNRAEQIEEYVNNKLPEKSQVAHLIFTFSENDPSELLKEDANKSKKPITHYSVGLRVDQHQELIEAVFKKATNG
jgi:hypothetical protein